MNSIFLESSRGTNTSIADGRMTPIADLISFLEKYYTRAHKQSKDERAESKNICVDVNAEERRIIDLIKEGGEVAMTELSQKC